MKHEFTVADMTCGHCVKTITTAIQKEWPTAVVVADTATHRLSVDVEADSAAVAAVVKEEGYTPVAA